jgi:hypothetical protein
VVPNSKSKIPVAAAARTWCAQIAVIVTIATEQRNAKKNAASIPPVKGKDHCRQSARYAWTLANANSAYIGELRSIKNLTGIP